MKTWLNQWLYIHISQMTIQISNNTIYTNIKLYLYTTINIIILN